MNIVVKLVTSSFKAINFIIDGLQLLHKLVEVVEIVDLGILRTGTVYALLQLVLIVQLGVVLDRDLDYLVLVIVAVLLQISHLL